MANVLWKQPRELGSKSQCARMGAGHPYSMYSWSSLNITSLGRIALCARPLCLSAHPLCSDRASYVSEFRYSLPPLFFLQSLGLLFSF